MRKSCVGHEGGSTQPPRTHITGVCVPESSGRPTTRTRPTTSTFSSESWACEVGREGRGFAPSAAEHPREPRGARHCVQHELPDLRGVAQDPNVPLCSISGDPACERRQEPA